MCASNSCLVKKALGQVSHFLFLMSKWRLFLWSIREETELKELPHSEHKCAFSPVWTGAWTANWWARAKALGHISHLYGRLPIIYTIIEPYFTIRNYNYVQRTIIMQHYTLFSLFFTMCTCIPVSWIKKSVAYTLICDKGELPFESMNHISALRLLKFH